jgi:hypothetical protein
MANKLKYYNTLGWEGLPVAKTLFYLANLYVTKKCLVVNTAQAFINVLQKKLKVKGFILQTPRAGDTTLPFLCNL